MELDDHDKLVIKQAAFAGAILSTTTLITIWIDGKWQYWPLILCGPAFAAIELVVPRFRYDASDRRARLSDWCARKNLHSLMKLSPFFLAVYTGLMWAENAGRWEIFWLIIAAVACIAAPW